VIDFFRHQPVELRTHRRNRLVRRDLHVHWPCALRERASRSEDEAQSSRQIFSRCPAKRRADHKSSPRDRERLFGRYRPTWYAPPVSCTKSLFRTREMVEPLRNAVKEQRIVCGIFSPTMNTGKASNSPSAQTQTTRVPPKSPHIAFHPRYMSPEPRKSARQASRAKATFRCAHRAQENNPRDSP